MIWVLIVALCATCMAVGWVLGTVQNMLNRTPRRFENKIFDWLARP